VWLYRKIKNVVVQTVAGYKFYELTNKALATTINTQFTTYTSTQSNFPFSISIIGISIQYPENTMELNDTLGIKLLKETSQLQQLNTQLSTLNSYIATYQDTFNNYTSQRVALPLSRPPPRP
jgi:hypothetical protein